CETGVPNGFQPFEAVTAHVYSERHGWRRPAADETHAWNRRRRRRRGSPVPRRIASLGLIVAPASRCDEAVPAGLLLRRDRPLPVRGRHTAPRRGGCASKDDR